MTRSLLWRIVSFAKHGRMFRWARACWLVSPRVQQCGTRDGIGLFSRCLFQGFGIGKQAHERAFARTSFYAVRLIGRFYESGVRFHIRTRRCQAFCFRNMKCFHEVRWYEQGAAARVAPTRVVLVWLFPFPTSTAVHTPHPGSWEAPLRSVYLVLAVPNRHLLSARTNPTESGTAAHRGCREQILACVLTRGKVKLPTKQQGW